MFKIIALILFLIILSNSVIAVGADQTIKQIFYCGDDFALNMSSGEWYVVRKADHSEQKFNHFYPMAFTMLSAGNKTGNMFPLEAVTWCGMSNVKPVIHMSIKSLR